MLLGDITSAVIRHGPEIAKQCAYEFTGALTATGLWWFVSLWRGRLEDAVRRVSAELSSPDGIDEFGDKLEAMMWEKGEVESWRLTVPPTRAPGGRVRFKVEADCQLASGRGKTRVSVLLIEFGLGAGDCLVKVKAKHRGDTGVVGKDEKALEAKFKDDPGVLTEKVEEWLCAVLPRRKRSK